MPPIFSSTQAFLTFLIQALLLLVALFAAWMFYRYLRSALGQNRLAATRKLAEVAVDYVEQLDGRGELGVPVGEDRAARKRVTAAQWLLSRLHEQGIRISEEQAQAWVAAEMHRRAGNQPPMEKLAEIAHSAVDAVQRLEQAHLLEVPADVNISVYMAGLAADWLAVELARLGVSLPRDQAVAMVRGDILHRFAARASLATIEDPLVRLAREAVEFMENLKASGRMTIQPGAAGGNVDVDVATGWMITEVAKRGMAATADQISEAIRTAFAQKAGPLSHELVQKS